MTDELDESHKRHKAARSRTSTSTMEGTNEINLTRDLYLRLQMEFRLIHLVWHRDKNQHKASIWWKRLSMMKRNCAQVIEILQYRTVDTSGQIIKLYKLINDFNRRQLPRTYHDFNGVIGLGQFVTLGVVLVGLLSRVYAIYRRIMEVFKEKFQNAGCLNNPVSLRTPEALTSIEEIQPYLELEEIGEEISEEHVKSHIAKVVTTKRQSSLPSKKSSKKKKGKKSKSVIDSIFG